MMDKRMIKRRIHKPTVSMETQNRDTLTLVLQDHSPDNTRETTVELPYWAVLALDNKLQRFFENRVEILADEYHRTKKHIRKE